MESNDAEHLTALVLCGEEIVETHVTDFERPVMLGTSRGTYFLLLPTDAALQAAWSCGLTLFAIPAASNAAGEELSVSQMMAYPRAQRLRVASLAHRGSTLRVGLSLAGAVG